MKNVRIGVVGAGHMGEYHITLLGNNYVDRAKFSKCCDVRRSRLNHIAKKFSVPVTTQYAEMLKGIDAVIIATPTDRHYEMARFFLSKGKHVLVEKPIAQNYTEAEELVDLSQKKGVHLHVGHIERFNGAVQELGKIVKNPYLIETRRMGPYNGRILNVGVTLDLMIHDIDIVVNLVHADIDRFSAYGHCIKDPGYEDVANVTIRFKNGTIANIIASRITQNKIRTLTVHQEDLYLYLDYTDQEIHIHRQASSASLTTKDEIRYSQESFEERLFIHKENPLKLELQHYVDCIQGRAKPVVNGQADIRILKITNQIVDAIRAMRPEIKC